MIPTLRIYITAALLVSTSTLLLACSDDTTYSDGSDPESLIGDADPNTPLSNLSTETEEEICASWKNALTSRFTSQQFCEGALALFAPDPATCQAIVSECVQENPLGELNCPDFPQPSDSCDATLREFDQCLRDQIDTGVSIYLSLSCQDAGTPAAEQAAQRLEDLETGGSCQTLVDNCPGALGLCTPETSANCECYAPETGASCQPSGFNDPQCDCYIYTPQCGDGWCEGDEANTCPQDCSSTPTEVCGDGYCAPSERQFCDTDCQTTSIDPYRFVLVEDLSQGASGTAPGADIDAIVVVKSDGSIMPATTVEDFGGIGNGDFTDPNQALDAPDSNCEVQNFVALGGADAGGYIIVGFADSFSDGIFEPGDAIVVHEIGSTMCPNNTYDDDPYQLSVSVSKDLGAFVEIATNILGNNPVTVPF